MFTIPKRFRLYFRYNRDLLSELSRCAWRTVQDVYGFALNESYRPGAVATIQTFGSLMLWNPHIHMIVTDGAFDESRRFHPMPETPTEPFLKVWEHHVFRLLIEKGRIKPQLANDMRQWDHTGFSVHKDVHIEEGDEEGLSRLSRYIARCPVAEAKITQDSVDDDVIYGADHPNPLPFQAWRANPDSTTTKRNFEVYNPLDFFGPAHPAHPGPGAAPDTILRLVFDGDRPLAFGDWLTTNQCFKPTPNTSYPTPRSCNRKGEGSKNSSLE